MPGPVPRSLRSIFVCIILFASLVFLLLFNLEPHSPLRQYAAGAPPHQQMVHWLSQLDQLYQDEAADGNLQLHFSGFDPNSLEQGLALCRYYYRANYDLYPHRAFIGTDSQIINGPADMLAADLLPDDRWLHEHNVAAAQTFIQTPTGVVGNLHMPR